MVEFNFKLETCNRLHMKAAASFFAILSGEIKGELLTVERNTEKVKTPDEIHAENVEADEYNNGNGEAPKEAPKCDETEEGEAPTKKRRRRTKAQIAAEKAKEESKNEDDENEAFKEEPKNEDDENEAPKEEPKSDENEAITKEDVRTALSTKIGTHRDEIVKKFKSFGAKNISTLEEKHYAEFIKFIENL